MKRKNKEGERRTEKWDEISGDVPEKKRQNGKGTGKGGARKRWSPRCKSNTAWKSQSRHQTGALRETLNPGKHS